MASFYLSFGEKIPLLLYKEPMLGPTTGIQRPGEREERRSRRVGRRRREVEERKKKRSSVRWRNGD